MLIDDIRRFKEKLAAGAVFGPFAKTKDPAFIEIAGYAGFDFVILDLEHGPNSIETAQDLIRAARLAKILPIVRVKEENDSVIKEALDIGAAGIQVPQVTTAEAAKKIVRLAKFAPDGMRGLCRFVRAANYSSLDRYEYIQSSNETLIIAQLEGQEAIANLDEIMDVKGIDVLFVGTYDLSQSLGVPGQVNHPLVLSKVQEIIERCQAKGIHVGSFADTLENAKYFKEAGVKYISYSSDMGLFYEQCRQTAGALRQG
ncbi:MAG: aldolase [Syntrophomonadaceae bacterium]|jgi:4-hydroxy-2-oxoheptanedioate aldolase|nr:aldolase [Syntrophomonadaceae bacterium]